MQTHDLDEISETVYRHELILHGKDGRGDGLLWRVARMERDLYADSQTGASGLIANVRRLQWVVYLVLFNILQNIPQTWDILKGIVGR